MMQKCRNFNNLNGEWVFREYRILSMDEIRGFDGIIVNTKSPFYGAYGVLQGVPRETLGGFTWNHIAFTLYRR